MKIGMGLLVFVKMDMREFIILIVFQFVEKIKLELMEFVNVKMVIVQSIIIVYLFLALLIKFGIQLIKFVDLSVL